MKAFDKNEKEYLNKMFMEKGKELFSTYGIKKTSIEDLTKSVGIAKGSFYTFFNSKEELYFKIMSEEIKNLAKENITTLDKEKPVKELIKSFLSNAIREIHSNPILNKLLVPGEFELVRRKMATVNSGDNTDFLGPMIMFLSKLQKEGLIIEIDPLLMANVIRGLLLLSTHKREIGEDYFDEVLQFYVDMIAEKLTDVNKGK